MPWTHLLAARYYAGRPKEPQILGRYRAFVVVDRAGPLESLLLPADGLPFRFSDAT